MYQRADVGLKTPLEITDILRVSTRFRRNKRILKEHNVPEAFLTAAEVAAWLKLNIETVYALIAKEGLPAVKIGGQWRFQESKIREWVEGRYAIRERCGGSRTGEASAASPSTPQARHGES